MRSARILPTHGPNADQSHIPRLTPRVGADTDLPVVVDDRNRVHWDEHCWTARPRMPAPRAGERAPDTTALPRMTLGELAALPAPRRAAVTATTTSVTADAGRRACVTCTAHTARRLLTAVQADDRRVAVTAVGATDGMAANIIAAGLHARNGNRLVGAVPLALARTLRDTSRFPVDHEPVLTVEAAGLLSTVAALWSPGGHQYASVRQAVRAARKLTA